MELSNFQTYFSDINLSQVVQDRIQSICNNISELYENIIIKDIFICDFKNGETKELTSLWLFSDCFVIECKGFLTQDDFDLTGLNNNVIYFNIKKFDYSILDNPGMSSSTIINVILNSGKLSCTLTASGENCKYAISAAKKYFLRHMITTRL